MIRKLAIFSVIGALATLAHYGILIALVNLGKDPVAASTAGAVIGASINYFLNRRITFRSRRAHREAAPRYFTVAAIGLGINGAVMASTVKLLGYYLVAQVIATAVVLLWNFFVNQHWTFGGEPDAR